MTKTACIFPGQGSQKVGMGASLFQNFAVAKDVFAEIDDTLSQKLSQLMFEGPEDELTLTANAQPAIMAVSVAAYRVMEAETGFSVKNAAFVAGHSLGEYSALAAAGTLSLADTAKLLRIRGNAMQEAVSAGQGSMAAILGLELDQVEAIAAQASEGGEICEVANDNSPGQVVLSGSRTGVEKAMELAKEAGAKRALELNVSAPFHCSLMQPAADAMQAALAEVAMHAPAVPLIANVTAAATSDVEAIRSQLVTQVTGRVRWTETMQFMKESGITRTIEIGEGKVLTGLMKTHRPRYRDAQYRRTGRHFRSFESSVANQRKDFANALKSTKSF